MSSTYAAASRRKAANPLGAFLSNDLKIPANRLALLDKLSKSLVSSECKECPLHKHRNGVNPVPGAGRGRIMFIGHRIGTNEANSGAPAIGAGSQYGFQLFVNALTDQVKMNDTQARVNVLDYAYVTNAARCGHEESTKPNVGAWGACSKKWLANEIRLVDPAILVFWKQDMARAVLGKKTPLPPAGSVGEVHVFGKKHHVFIMNHPVSITYNPAFKSIIDSQFATLAIWLHEQGYLTQEPVHVLDQMYEDQVTHVLVENDSMLQEMLEDLWDKKWLSLDVETTFRRPGERLNPYEEKYGAIMWYDDGFDLVTIQLASQEADGTVSRAYTIPIGFRDPLTDELQFPLSSDAVRAGLDALLRHKLNNAPRIITMWNAEFDCSAMTRFGIDLLGFSNWSYPVQVIDGQLVLVRYDEHMADLNQLSLDAAGKMFLLEGKGGSFKSHFDPKTFPYQNMRNPDVRQKVLDYAGGDVIITLRLTIRLLELFAEQIQSYVNTTSLQASGLPPLGYPPFPTVATDFNHNRLQDVGIPMDHQMVPVISEMTMIGFNLDTQAMAEVDRHVEVQQRQLLAKIHNHYSWLNPKSPRDLRRIVDDTLKQAANQINNLCLELDNEPVDKEYAKALRMVLRACGLKSRNWRRGSPSFEDLLEAYTTQYGKLDTQQATIEDKFFVFLSVSQRTIEKELGQYSPAIQALIRKYLPLVPMTALEEVFNLIYIHNQLNKKKSTYIDRFRRLADRYGVFHPSYRQATTSGRFQGNFQNIPRGGEEDEEWTEKLLLALGHTLPKRTDHRENYIRKHNRLDVRQYISAVQSDGLNRLFKTMNLKAGGKPWQVRDGDEYVLVTADFAAQEDRTAYALSGDATKERLLSDSSLDTHFYNVAFCFGKMHGYDTDTEEGIMAAYKFFTRDKKYKAMYRTPMKTVHYAVQYGAGENKLHGLLGPIFAKMDQPWGLADTQALKSAYDELYQGVTSLRARIIKSLDTTPYLEYPIYGVIRHAKSYKSKVHQSEYLSVANAVNQGTSAYITKTAMLRMRHLIHLNAQRWNLVHQGGDTYAGILIQVHDEIGVLCPKRLAPEVALCLESAMKIIVGPTPEDGTNEAFWDDTVSDSRGETGWLFVPDEKLKGITLFDADAEVKTHLAKGRKLASGALNILGTTADMEGLEAIYEGDRRINQDYPLILARKGHAPFAF